MDQVVARGETPRDDARSSQARSLPFSDNIHYLRGLAAVSVVLFHAGFYFNHLHKVDFYKELFPGTLGLYGVAIFFAISGFLMATLVQKQQPVDFLWRRIARIYPMLLIATVVTLAVRPEGLGNYQFASITLAPIGPTTYPLRVEWSLVNEMFFYVLVFTSVVLLPARWISLLAAIWLLAIVANTFAGWSNPVIGRATILNVALMPANAGFAASLLIPSLLKFSVPPLALALFFGACMVSTIYFAPEYLHWLFAGLGSTALIAAALRSTISFPRVLHVPFSKLGDWSYAMYLVHVPVFYVVFSLSDLAPTPALFAVWIGAVLLVSAVAGEADLFISRHVRQLNEKRRIIHVIVYAFLAIYLVAAAHRLIA